MRFKFIAKLIILSARNVNYNRFRSLSTFPFRRFAHLVCIFDNECTYCKATLSANQYFTSAEFIELRSQSWAYVYLCEDCGYCAEAGLINRQLRGTFGYPTFRF